jgi:hypothetical protein
MVFVCLNRYTGFYRVENLQVTGCLTVFLVLRKSQSTKRTFNNSREEQLCASFVDTVYDGQRVGTSVGILRLRLHGICETSFLSCFSIYLPIVHKLTSHSFPSVTYRYT